ncbi:MAG: hypothetical protein L6290_05335 [Thermodesulfovibrionales bacterium]|nr:hypothetical protein [Thermodesulfovibrionales bacterium]
MNWKDIVEDGLQPTNWKDFSEEAREEFFREAQEDERSDLKAFRVAQTMWLK